MEHVEKVRGFLGEFSEEILREALEELLRDCAREYPWIPRGSLTEFSGELQKKNLGQRFIRVSGGIARCITWEITEITILNHSSEELQENHSHELLGNILKELLKWTPRKKAEEQFLKIFSRNFWKNPRRKIKKKKILEKMRVKIWKISQIIFLKNSQKKNSRS